ncbi:unnamed protein product [Ectocarpus sp. 6 AP-2014]
MMATVERDPADWDPEDSQSGQNLLGKNRGGGKAEGGRGSPPPPGPKISMCGLLSLQYYQPYFDVDTSEVKTKLLQAIWPMRKTASFLGEADSSKVDLYGPVWVPATLIFLLSVAVNARRAMTDDASLGEFDDVSTSAYSVLAYLAIGTGGLWAFFRTHGVPLSFAEALSVYGYSLTPFLAAAPLCLLSWPFRSCGLAAASLVAAIFVLRSSWPRLQEHMPEKSMVLLLTAVATYHVLWFLLLTVV